MSIFKRKTKFVAAICPECKGHLELDSNLQTAFCQYCGAQCIVENAPKKEKKQTKLETVLDFFERQQNLHRQDKQERQRRIEEEKRKEEEHLKKYWIVYVLILFSIFALLFTFAFLEKQSII